MFIGSERNRHLVGKRFAGLANERGMTGIDPALDLLIEEKGVVNILSFNQSEENPLCTVISGGFSGKGRPHPRLQSTFPCPLGEIVRQRSRISLPRAIRKITGSATYETPELAPVGDKLVFRGGIHVTPPN